jgi:alpha-glucosidase
MKLLVSNYPSSELGTLQPYEGRVYISWISALAI